MVLFATDVADALTDHHDENYASMYPQPASRLDDTLLGLQITATAIMLAIEPLLASFLHDVEEHVRLHPASQDIDATALTADCIAVALKDLKEKIRSEIPKSAHPPERWMPDYPAVSKTSIVNMTDV
jgi:hypothetical protein